MLHGNPPHGCYQELGNEWVTNQADVQCIRRLAQTNFLEIRRDQSSICSDIIADTHVTANSFVGTNYIAILEEKKHACSGIYSRRDTTANNSNLRRDLGNHDSTQRVGDAHVRITQQKLNLMWVVFDNFKLWKTLVRHGGIVLIGGW